MSTETLTIVLKGDGTGLTGTLRTASGQVQQFGAVLDTSSGKVTATGAASRRAARDIDALDASAKRSQTSARDWASSLNTVRGTLATLGISLVVRELLDAGLQMQRFQNSLTAATGSQAAAASSMGFLRAEAQRLGIYLPTLAQGYVGLAAATRGTALEGEKTRRVFSAVAEAGRAMNLSAESMSGIFTALSQIAGKGTLSMEELRQQLGDRLPGAMQIAARSMGYTVAEFVKLVSEGRIASEDFLPKFADELHKASAAAAMLNANSPAAEFQRLKTALFEVGAVASQGALNTLGASAGALASALTGLVTSGALATIVGLLGKVALAAVVFYAGSLLQRGVALLRDEWIKQSIALNTASAGMTAAGGSAARLTVMQTAAAVASRGLASALALVQANAVMLVVTAVAYLATKLVTAKGDAEQAATALREGFRSAKQALDDFNKTPSLAGAFTLGDAKIGESIDNLRQKLAELRKEQIALDQAGSHMGVRENVAAKAYKSLADEVANTTRQLLELQLGANLAAGHIADLVQGATGLTNVTPLVRSELLAVTAEMSKGNLQLDDAIPKLREIIEKHYGLDVAARLSASGVLAFSGAMDQSTKDMEGYAKQLDSLLVQMAGIRDGAAGGARMKIGQDINAAALAAGGGDRDKGMQLLRETGELTKYGQALAVITLQTQRNEAAQKAQTEARKSSTAALRDQHKAGNELQRDQTKWLDTIASTRAELAGPLKVAEYERDQRLKSISEALKGNAINETQAKEAREQATEQYRRNTVEIDKNAAALRERQNVMGQLGAEMAEEIRLSAMSTDQRRIEETVIRARNQAIQEGAAFNEAAARAMVASADVQIRANEDLVHAAEEYRNAWVGAASDAARAFGDWFANGMKGGKDFAKSLKDIFKRLVSDLVAMFLQNSLVKPFQNWLQQIGSAGSSNTGMGAQQQGSNMLGQLFNTGMDKLTSYFGKLFGRGGAAQSAVEAGTSSGFGTWTGSLVQSGSMQANVLAGMPAGQTAGASSFSGMSGWMMPVAGAAMGWSQGGDTAGKIGGALAGGVAGYGLAVGASAAGFAGAAGAGIAGSASAGLAAIPVVGWIALAAIAINLISGGKLFGTKFKAESGSQSIGISEAGATGSQSVTEVRQKSFFRGREWKTTTTGLDAEAMAAVNELFDTLSQTVTTAATALGVEIPDLVGGTFKREFDSKGNLTKEFSTIAGRVYYEAQEAFAKRLVAENLINVAKQAGGGAEIESLANNYRGDVDALQAFAALALAVQADIKNATGIWHGSGEGVLTKIVTMVEGLAKAGETLADAYGRIAQTITTYGDLIGGVRQQIAVHGLNQYQKAQLDVEMAYRAQVKQANELAKALGLTGARAEDLASIEQLRALNMADLAKQYAAQQTAQNQTWLQDLSMSELSPLRDDQKLAQVMALLQESSAAGDVQRSQKLAEQALNLGRELYASGDDYNALYAQVTSLVGDLNSQSMEELQGLTNEQLATLADLMTGLPASIAQALAALLLVTPPVGTPPDTAPAPLPPPPAPSPPSGGGGGGGGGGSCVAFDMFMDDGSRAIDAEAGNVHVTHDPVEGFARKQIRVRGEAVLQPCVRIVTDSGAALVCSRSTPFTDVEAPVDTPEFTTLAPDMLGRKVYAQRPHCMGYAWSIETVVAVEDAGMREVIPMDFGGRSFAAGESRDALIYSHNMMKVSSDGMEYAQQGVMVGEPSPYGNDRSSGSMSGTLLRIAEGVESQNAKLDRLELDRLNAGSRVQWKTNGAMY